MFANHFSECGLGKVIILSGGGLVSISEATDYGFAAAGMSAPLDARFLPTWPVPAVLPVLTGEDLRSALRRLNFRELQKCLHSRLLPLPDTAGHAMCGERGRFSASIAEVQVVARIGRHEFAEAVRHVWGEALRDRATFTLDQRKPVFSARKRFSLGQLASLCLVIAAVTAGIWFLPSALLQAATLSSALIFLAVVAVRVLVLLPRASISPLPPPSLDDDDLPVYSVLVPLFRETTVLDQLLGALGNFDYPHGRLDIKIVLEEDDRPMRQAIADFRLPSHFEVIVVPRGKPQTKPRALNYALQFAYGELVTIYDAEDLPSPTQLRRCAEAFAAASPRLACLQARLTIYNGNENWLTRQFALEYAMLFGEVLPALAAMQLPLPLGGTSNHFRGLM